MFRNAAFHIWAAVLLFAPAMSAQQTSDVQNVPVGAVGISTWFSVVSIPPVPHAPFSATTLMDNIQPQPDGTTVTTRTMTTIARDSEGRTHNENRYYLTPSDNGQGRIRDITIFDPTTRVRTTLIPDTLQAIVVTLLPRQPGPMSLPIRPVIQREDLGVSSIDGLVVHGFRQSRTVPEGTAGNDPPITITDEYWYSDELHMNITLKRTDPQHGTQFVTLTQVSRGEPDEKMFKVPAEYEVRDESEKQGAVRIGAGAAAASRIEGLEPLYPPLARTAGVQGSVEFSVLIGKDGSVKSVQLVRGHPLLVNAAKEAVVRWKYRPMLINANAVNVIAPVIVNFALPDAGEPAARESSRPSAPAEAPPNALIGRWRSLETSKGGIGAIFEFRPDGVVDFSPGAVVEEDYRIEDRQVITSLGVKDGRPETKQPIRWSGPDRVLLGETSERGICTVGCPPCTCFDLTRVGSAIDLNNPIWGEWTLTQKLPEGRPELRLLFYAGGRRLLLAPFVTHQGRYSVSKDIIHLELEGGTVEGQFEVTANRLILPSPSGTGESRFARY